MARKPNSIENAIAAYKAQVSLRELHLREDAPLLLEIAAAHRVRRQIGVLLEKLRENNYFLVHPKILRGYPATKIHAAMDDYIDSHGTGGTKLDLLRVATNHGVIPSVLRNALLSVKIPANFRLPPDTPPRKNPRRRPPH